MRTLLFALALLFGTVSAAASDVRVSIGIHVPMYPTLHRVPGYPVYYAPSLRANYFFYDGLYWVFDGYDWWMSAWYNGPWQLVDRYEVPVYLLRVPVRYYRAAPVYFHSWHVDYAPRWGDHWGYTWRERRAGWDTFSLRSAPAPAPLPVYQRQYTGTRYPALSEQVVIQTRNYRYQPKDTVVRQQWQELRGQATSAQPREGRVTREQRVQAQRAEQRAQARIEQRQAQRAEQRAQARIEQRQAQRVEREQIVRAEKRAQGRDRPAPPAQAQAKGWPGKGQERALERSQERVVQERVVQERVAQGPPPRAQAKGRERAQGKEKDDDHPGRGRDR